MPGPIMDEARESSYDPTLLTTNVSNRHITLSSIRDAAGAVYQAAIRTPLIRVELPDAGAGSPSELYLKLEALQPIGSFKIRGAYNVVRQLTRGAAEGRRVDGQRRQRRAGRGVRRAQGRARAARSW